MVRGKFAVRIDAAESEQLAGIGRGTGAARDKSFLAHVIAVSDAAASRTRLEYLALLVSFKHHAHDASDGKRAGDNK